MENEMPARPTCSALSVYLREKDMNTHHELCDFSRSLLSAMSHREFSCSIEVLIDLLDSTSIYSVF